MINAILTGIFNLVIGLVDIILTPIDLAIEAALPSLDGAINGIGQLFALISNSLGWAISLTGISSECIALIVTYYVFKLTLPITFSLIKSALAWYDKLKP